MTNPSPRNGPDPVRILAWIALGALGLTVVCCCTVPLFWTLAVWAGIAGQ